MNYIRAKRQVLNDLHLKDILECLRNELIRKPKPTIGELMTILSQIMIDDTIDRYRRITQTVFEFDNIEFMKYFPILWIIIIEEYPDLCINEYDLLEDSEVAKFFHQFKQSSRSCYNRYIQSL